MSWFTAMKGQKTWKDVIPGKKKALRPRQKERPSLPKLGAWERKRLAAADMQAAHHPMGHGLGEQPVKKRKRIKKDGPSNACRRAFVEEFFRTCRIVDTGLSTRGEVTFGDWKRLYHRHRLTATVAGSVLRGVGLRLVEKSPGRRVWQATRDSASLLIKLYEAP